MASRSFLLVAGEASGDLHGARLLAALQQRDPHIEAFGFGGEELRAVGLEAVASEDIAVVGLFEVLKVLPKARRVFRQILKAVEERRPEAAILIDYPEFNLRLAAKLKKRGIPVIYYISPQIWAWRRGRVRKIAHRVDLMLVLFPFEAAFYRDHAVEVVHVGHPLVDEVPALPQIWDQEPAAGQTGPYRIALLPGSRPNEVAALLPSMLEAVRLLAQDLPILPRLIRARTISRGQVDDHVRAAGLAGSVEVVSEDRFQAVAESHLAFCASGTATLETGLAGTPLLVLYRLASWTYLLAKVLVRLPYFSLVNLVLEEAAVPELMQDETEPRQLARRARELLADPEAIVAMRLKLARLRQKLGQPGASGRAADAILGWLAAKGMP